MSRPIQGTGQRHIGERATMLARFGDGAQTRLALALDFVGGEGRMLCDVGKQGERVREVARQCVNLERGGIAMSLQHIARSKPFQLAGDLLRGA